MLNIYRLATLAALFSIFHLTTAHADLEKIKYLAALDQEVTATSPDETTVLKGKLSSYSWEMHNKQGPQHLSQNLFMDYMKEKYPASHRVFDTMTPQHQNQVYANYQTHLDFNKSRKEMMELWRNK